MRIHDLDQKTFDETLRIILGGDTSYQSRLAGIHMSNPVVILLIRNAYAALSVEPIASLGSTFSTGFTIGFQMANKLNEIEEKKCN